MIRLDAVARVPLIVAALAGGVAAAVAHSAAHPASGVPEAALRVLRTIGGFSATDIARLERGEPVATILDTDKREVAVVGAVRVAAPVDRLMTRSRNVAALKTGDAVLEVGRIGPAPAPEDFRDLTFETYDLDTIRDCEPGDCGVRVPADAMARFAREITWSAADWRQQAATLWRRVLAGYTAGYLARGAAALAEYHNKEVPLSVAQEFDVLFERSRALEASAPEFFRHLRGFPAARLDGAEDIFYWSKVDFGIRPVLAITHLSLYRAGPPSPSLQPAAIIATKQIYATHYFDAALGLTMAFDEGAGGFYMLCVNRARTRSLASFMRALVRATVQKRSREALDKFLRSTKASLEAPLG